MAGLLSDFWDRFRGLGDDGTTDYWRRGGLAAGLGMPAWNEQSPQDIALGFAGGGMTKLPMDAMSRLARAAEQGFTIDAFKGAPFRIGGPWRNWKGEVIGNSKTPYQELTHFNNPDKPYAGFFTDDAKVASRFADAFGESGAVAPVKIRKFSNPVVIDAQGKPAAAFQFATVAEEHGTREAFNKFATAFDDPKVDGVVLKNTKDEGTVFVPRDPQQVRSRFAAFDPQKITSPDLLASGVGLLGGGLGLYGLTE